MWLKLGVALIAGVPVVLAAVVSTFGAYFLGLNASGPPTKNISVKSIAVPLASQCTTFTGTAGFQNGWELWASAHTANYIGGDLTLTQIFPTKGNQWSVSLNLGKTSGDAGVAVHFEKQVVAVDFFYLDKNTADTLRLVPSRTLSALPPAQKLIEKVYELDERTQATPCS